MNQKERDEAFRRGQNSNTGEHHTEEEWRERRQLRRQRQRRKRRMRRILTAVCGVAAVAVGVIIVKCFIIDMLISSDHIVVRDPDSVLRTESRDVGSQSVPQTTPPMQSQWETAQATQPITTAASPTTNASVTPAVPVTTGAPSLHRTAAVHPRGRCRRKRSWRLPPPDDSFLDSAEFSGGQRLFQSGLETDRYQ